MKIYLVCRFIEQFQEFLKRACTKCKFWSQEGIQSHMFCLFGCYENISELSTTYINEMCYEFWLAYKSWTQVELRQNMTLNQWFNQNKINNLNNRFFQNSHGTKIKIQARLSEDCSLSSFSRNIGYEISKDLILFKSHLNNVPKTRFYKAMGRLLV